MSVDPREDPVATKCPSCGAPVDSQHSECADCGMTLKDSTLSFAPVGDSVESASATSEGSENPVLVVRKGPEIGERFYLDRPSLTIGRDPSSDIFLNNVTVSRKHASFAVAGAEVSIEDAGSLNGTYVNGVCVDKALLRTGDVVQIGMFQMVFLAGESE